MVGMIKKTSSTYDKAHRNALKVAKRLISGYIFPIKVDKKKG